MPDKHNTHQSEPVISRRRAQLILERYGADPLHWPASERLAVARWIARDQSLLAWQDREALLDDALGLAATPRPEVSATLQSRLLAQHAAVTAPVAVKTERLRHGPWVDLVAALGGFRVVGPVLATAFAVGVALGQFVPNMSEHTGTTSATDARWDVLALAQLVTDTSDMQP